MNTAFKRSILSMMSSTLLACLSVACDSESECDSVGQGCAKSCDTGYAPICVAQGICECVSSNDGGASPGGASSLAGVEGGQGGGVVTSCAQPPMGALIINELLVDAVNEDTGEFFELANLHDDFVDLSGVKIVYRGSDKVRFLSGCMAPKSVAALWGDEAAWAWSTRPSGLEYEKLSYRLSNSGDVLAQLFNESDPL